MIRVVVAEDQDLVRTGLRLILDAADDVEVVAEVGDGREAIDAVRRHVPDVVVMDIRMPEVDGIEATRTIARDHGDRCRVLVLTTYDLDEHLYDAIRAGASGFFLKTAPPDQLVQAVRTVAGGEALLAPSLTRRLMEQFARQPPPTAEVPPALAALSDREVDVLRCVAKGLSNAEIGARLFVSEATVKTHINRLFRKLDVRDRVQAVVLAYETGLVRAGTA